MASSNGHWYFRAPDGTVTSRYDADLRIARKEGLYPSVTTVEKNIRANGQLGAWITRETIKACVEYPKMEWEDIKDYTARIEKASGKIAETAADFGTRLHDALEFYPQMPLDAQIQPYFDRYAAWHEANVLETISSETMLANPLIGVAGKMDKLLVHKEHGRCLVDFKSQSVKAKPNFYSSWARQLAFYAKTYSMQFNCEVPRIMSIIIDSNEPKAPVAHLWSQEDQDQGWNEFVLQAWLWAAEKDYWPVGKWDVSFVLNFMNDTDSLKSLEPL